MARTTDAKTGRLMPRATRPVTARRGVAAFAVWERIARYLREVRTELGRVDWQSRKELTASTLIVVVVLVVLALYLGAWDYLFTLSIRRWLVGP